MPPFIGGTVKSKSEIKDCEFNLWPGLNAGHPQGHHIRGIQTPLIAISVAEIDQVDKFNRHGASVGDNGEIVNQELRVEFHSFDYLRKRWIKV